MKAMVIVVSMCVIYGCATSTSSTDVTELLEKAHKDPAVAPAVLSELSSKGAAAVPGLIASLEDNRRLPGYFSYGRPLFNFSDRMGGLHGVDEELAATPVTVSDLAAAALMEITLVHAGYWSRLSLQDKQAAREEWSRWYDARNSHNSATEH